MNHSSAIKLLLCLCVIVAPDFSSLGQNSNSSSKEKPKRTAKRGDKKEEPPKLDLSGIEPIKLSALDFAAVDALIRQEKEWPRVAGTSYYSVAYGVKTVRRLNATTVRVWTKSSLKDDTDEIKSEFQRNRKAHGLRTVGYEKYSHTLELDEYRCSAGQGRVLVQVDYDKSGNVIDSMTYKNQDWSYIVPDSIGESLFRAVCKQK